MPVALEGGLKTFLIQGDVSAKGKVILQKGCSILWLCAVGTKHSDTRPRVAGPGPIGTYLFPNGAAAPSSCTVSLAPNN